MVLMDLPEQRNRSRNADRLEFGCGLAPGQGVSCLAEQIVWAAALGCHFTAIEHVQCLLLRVPEKKKAAAS